MTGATTGLGIGGGFDAASTLMTGFTASTIGAGTGGGTTFTFSTSTFFSTFTTGATASTALGGSTTAFGVSIFFASAFISSIVGAAGAVNSLYSSSVQSAYLFNTISRPFSFE